MIEPNYPSQYPSHRRADLFVHFVGLVFVVTAGSLLIFNALDGLEYQLVVAVFIYVLCVLISNLASWAYHFSGWHDRRTLLRRMDHSAIYLSISGTFTPFFVQAATTWTFTLLWLCWGLTVLAIWLKVFGENVKSKWSTASYLGLGGIGLCALPDLTNVPSTTLWCIMGGASSYVVGTTFYARKSMPFRYAIWHGWVNLGGSLMFAGIWMALF